MKLYKGRELKIKRLSSQVFIVYASSRYLYRLGKYQPIRKPDRSLEAIDQVCPVLKLKLPFSTNICSKVIQGNMPLAL